MPHNEQKETMEASLIGKIFCMESLIFIMGCASLYYGVSQDKGMSIFWGCTILIGFVALRLTRKKDWKKHWEELEQEQQKSQQNYKTKE